MAVSQETIELLRGVIVAGRPWVLFENGTVVVVADDPIPDDLAGAAAALLRAEGPVHAGGAPGDFGVVALPEKRGWLVTSHVHEIFTYVAPDAERPVRNDLSIGLLGRTRRNADAKECTVVHVQRPEPGDSAGSA